MIDAKDAAEVVNFATGSIVDVPAFIPDGIYRCKYLGYKTKRLFGNSPKVLVELEIVEGDSRAPSLNAGIGYASSKVTSVRAAASLRGRDPTWFANSLRSLANHHLGLIASHSSGGKMSSSTSKQELQHATVNKGYFLSRVGTPLSTLSSEWLNHDCSSHSDLYSEPSP